MKKLAFRLCISNSQSLSNPSSLPTKYNCRSKPTQLQKAAIFISLSYKCIFFFLLSL